MKTIHKGDEDINAVEIRVNKKNDENGNLEKEKMRIGFEKGIKLGDIFRKEYIKKLNMENDEVKDI
jgi:hypothetical protein